MQYVKKKNSCFQPIIGKCVQLLLIFDMSKIKHTYNLRRKSHPYIP